MGQFQLKQEVLTIKKLIELALDNPEAEYDSEKHPSKQDLVDKYCGKLTQQIVSEFLESNFSIKIENGVLVGLPIVNESVKPISQDLPMFLLRIALINYNDESLSLHRVAEELSFFYAKYIDMLQLK